MIYAAEVKTNKLKQTSSKLLLSRYVIAAQLSLCNTFPIRKRQSTNVFLVFCREIPL